MTMGQFDESKDVCVAKLGSQKVIRTGGHGLRARVYSYDGGSPRVAIERIYVKKDGDESHRKLGRLTLEEAKFVARMMGKFDAKVESGEIVENEPKKTEAKTKKTSKKKTANSSPKATKKEKRRRKKPEAVGGW